MISRTMKILSATVVAAAFVATVTVARTVYQSAAVAGSQHAANTVGAAPRAMTPLAAQGTLACGMALSSDCGKIETWLPE